MINREQLRFAEETQVAFAFLEETFGFKRVHASARKIRFESAKAYIEINHDNYDFGVSVIFGRLHRIEPELLDFTLFLKLVNASLEKTLGERIADTPDKIRETVHKLAGAMRSEGSDIIAGTDAVFDRMKSVAWWQFQPVVLRRGDEER